MPLGNPVLNSSLNQVNLDELKQEFGPPPWSRKVVVSDHLAANVICQPPGFDQNDWHCHNYDEWWIVLEGEIDWIIEGREGDPVHAREGDFIYVPAMTYHQIFPKAGETTIRLGVALPGTGGHLHERPARKAKVTVEN